MDSIGFFKKMRILFGKYKYAVLILALGVLLMLFPQQKQNTKLNTADQEITEEETTLSVQLEMILGKIDRVGTVKVLLSQENSEERVFQTNDSHSSSESSSNIKIDTVIISDSDRKQNGLVKKVVSPIYRGAIVVCQGGDDPAVKLAITQAVGNITGLSSDCISVLKMK